MQSNHAWDLDVMPEDVREQAAKFKRGMSPTHLLMAEWIIQNPGKTLRDMGAFFGYSSPWLSQIINSDMFKAHLAGRVKDIQAVVTQDVPEKMRALATLSIDRMTEVVQTSSDPELLLDSFDKIMHRYGYAPNAKTAMQPQGPTNIGQQNNVFYLSPTDLAAAREKLINAHAATPALPNQEAPAEDAKQPEPAPVKALSSSD